MVKWLEGQSVVPSKAPFVSEEEELTILDELQKVKLQTN